MKNEGWDDMWSAQQREQARGEGWDLCLVVDEGKPVSSAYLDIFDVGPQFKNKRAAAKHVLETAKKGNAPLHLHALSACSASRMRPAPKGKK